MISLLKPNAISRDLFYRQNYRHKGRFSISTNLKIAMSRWYSCILKNADNGYWHLLFYQTEDGQEVDKVC